MYVFVGIMVQLLVFSILIGVYFKHQLDPKINDNEKSDSSGIFGWSTVYFVASFMLACCIGRIFKMLVVYVPIFMGCFLGFTAGSMMITFIEHLYDALFNSHNDVFGTTSTKIFLAIFVLMGFCFGMKLGLLATVITQAFMASFFVVRGISLWFGGFPSE